MTAVVRPAGPADVPLLLPLVEEYWAFERIEGFDEARIASELARLLGHPHIGAGWIAADGPRGVGYLLAVLVFSLEHLGMTAEIDELYVAPTIRNAGIGAGLLKAAEAEFVRRGCTNVSLQLGRENDRGRQFYRAHGYRRRAGFELFDKMLPRG